MPDHGAKSLLHASTPRGRDIDAVIFDLDGTLVDSEPNYFEALRKVLAEHRVDFTLECNRRYVGIGVKEVVDHVKAVYAIDEAAAVMMERINAYYIDFAKKNTPVFPEMKKLVAELKKHDYPLAVASGSSRSIIEMILSTADMEPYFDVVISSEEVGKGKPEPDVFLEAAKRLGILPERCLVIEDSQYGVLAAKSAAMHCIAMPGSFDESMQAHYAMADLLFKNGIHDFSAEQVLKWVRTDCLAV
ncbi:hypothetical protein P22_0985 [Propionispora sp. 2/2-37]|uniref:HAD family hydrolase n=1 Tax=Propionispora sp. 2/2-37 TaxID=1677858 RepID=UPI0006BB765F|nr:HAD family phosphatase [Propionispora sp. 2/2-37]CUH94916.1 hypothetical protein P22_0985 [Propionispora sp. 2/2-37]